MTNFILTISKFFDNFLTVRFQWGAIAWHHCC